MNNTRDSYNDRISAARREAETLKEAVKKRKEELADGSCKYFIFILLFFLGSILFILY